MKPPYKDGHRIASGDVWCGICKGFGGHTAKHHEKLKSPATGKELPKVFQFKRRMRV